MQTGNSNTVVEVGMQVRVGEKASRPVYLTMLGRVTQSMAGSRQMARFTFSRGLHFSRSLSYTMGPEFPGGLKKAGVLGKSFLLSAHQCSCLMWQI